MNIVIDGNIGSGKTTQLGLLEKKGWKVQREPIDQWPLDDFYKDPKRWAFLLHMMILKTLQPKKSRTHVLLERGLMSSRHVFWPVLVKQGCATPEEDRTYSYFYDKTAWYPDLYIYLAKSPEKAFEHIQSRHQAGDSGVTLEYLKKLDVEYKKLIRNVPCKVIIVNAERSVEEIHTEICRHLSENELFFGDSKREQVPAQGDRRREVPCTSIAHMCCVS
jgi:deoxyadenosine/deoxycytidine kinase